MLTLILKNENQLFIERCWNVALTKGMSLVLSILTSDAVDKMDRRTKANINNNVLFIVQRFISVGYHHQKLNHYFKVSYYMEVNLEFI